MARAAVHIDGMDDLVSRLETVFPREANNILRRTVTRIAATVRDDMRKNVVKRGGALKKAIRSRRERGSQGVQEAAVWITHGKNQRNDAYYWHMIEFGTVKMPAAPFIQPSVERTRWKLGSIYRREFGQQFEREMARRAKRRRR